MFEKPPHIAPFDPNDPNRVVIMMNYIYPYPFHGQDNDIIIWGNGLFELQMFTWQSAGAPRTYFDNFIFNIFDLPLDPTKSEIFIKASMGIMRNIINSSHQDIEVARANSAINSTGWMILKPGERYTNSSGAIVGGLGIRNITTTKSYGFGNGIFILTDQPL